MPTGGAMLNCLYVVEANMIRCAGVYEHHLVCCDRAYVAACCQMVTAWAPHVLRAVEHSHSH
eukprot:5082655-Amphidinium_carterae.1